MNQEPLAITSVPKQIWGGIVQPSEALRQGTIFPELNLPFFAVSESADVMGTQSDPRLRDSIMENLGKSSQQRQREDFMRKIQEISFTVDDLRLFLDTHPQEQKGMEALREALCKRKELLRDFALTFDPLTTDCMAEICEQNLQKEGFSWTEGPMPWEGACV